MLTVLRIGKAGQCTNEFSGTGHKIECITLSSFWRTGHKTKRISEFFRLDTENVKMGEQAGA